MIMAGSARILLCDGVAKKAVAKLAEKKFEIEEVKALSEDELIAKLNAKTYDCVVVRSSTKVTAKVFQAQKGLKLVGRAGVGVDTIDVKAATAAGVKVMNTPGGNANAVVELTMGLMLGLARQIPKADRSMKAGKWEKKAFKGAELKGKVLGLIGVGKIGAEVAKRARAFGMSVIGYDPHLEPAKLKDVCEQVKTLDEIYSRADFISIHTPMTPETKNLIGEAAIGKMKAGVRIVNAARGGILDEAALVKALVSGKVAGAALDVYGEEPPKNIQDLLDDRLILTPHIGAATEESQDTCAEMMSDQIIEFFLNNRSINMVN